MSLADDGYLVDPDRDWGSVFNPDVVPFSEISSIRCLALLGEPGLGKTDSLQSEFQVARGEAGNEALWLDLRSCGSDYKLMRDLFDSAVFIRWAAGQHQLHVFLDSLDECLLRIDNVAALLVDELTKHDESLDRLCLRISCRSADWPRLLDEGLRELWGQEHIGIYELAPLRRMDVIAAASAEGLDPDAFLAEIAQSDAVPLAIKPVTLHFLIETYRDARRLPPNQVELYLEGCRRLCEERNLSRRSAGRKGTLSATQRLAIASRVAAVSALGNRYAVWSGLREDAPDEDILIDDLIGGQERADGRDIEVSLDHVRETIGTGLFSARGLDRVGWAHQTYSEFLAARFLVQRGLGLQEMMALLVHEDGHLVPQLREVAGWLATMAPEVLREIMRIEPDVLLRSDLAVASEQDRADIAATLLRLYDEGALARPRPDLRSRYGKLAHARLAEVVRPYIVDRTRRLTARALAVDIAEACGLASLEMQLVEVALAGDEIGQLRARAAAAIWRMGDEAAKAMLRPLALGQAGDDPNDELKGYGLLATWPNHLEPHQRFAVLTPPRQPNFAGSYQFFLKYHLRGRVYPIDLPAALQWGAQQRQVPLALADFGEIRDSLMLSAWEHLDAPGVVETFAQVALERITTAEPIVGGESAAAFRQSLAEADEKRRHVIGIMLPMLAASGGEPSWLVYADTQVVFTKDVPWLLDRLRAESDVDVRRVLVGLITQAYDPTDPEQVEAVFEASQGNSDLNRELGWYVDLASARAAQARQAHLSRRRAPRTNRRDSAKSSAGQVVALLDRSESGNIVSAWPELTRELVHAPDGSSAGDDLDTDLTRLAGWQATNATTQDRILVAAEKYLLEADPSIDSWIDTGSIPFAVFAGYQALILLHNARPAIISALPAETWRRWIRVVFAAAMTSSPEEERAVQELVLQAYRTVPDETIRALTEALAGENQRNGQVVSLWKIERCWDDRLINAMEGLARDSSMTPGSMLLLLRALLVHGSIEARSIATCWVTAYEASGADIEARARAVAAARALLTCVPDVAWPTVWAVIERDAEFGRDLLDEVAWDDEEAQLERRLSEEQVADLYIWLMRRYPEAAGDSGAHEMGVSWVRPAQRVSAWRDRLPGRLADRGTAAAVSAIRRVVEELSEHVWLHEVLREAEAQARRRSWVPLSPQDIVQLVGRSASDPDGQDNRGPTSVLSVHASGDHSAAIGGNVVNSTINLGPVTYQFPPSEPLPARGANASPPVVDGHAGAPGLGPEEVFAACQKLTKAATAQYLERSPTIPRPSIDYALRQFASSPARYCILRGSSGVGKSVSLATQASRLLDDGWATLFMKGTTFSLSYLAERVAFDGLELDTIPEWRRIAVRPWSSTLPYWLRGFVLVVDGMDDGDVDRIGSELMKLDAAVSLVPVGRVKILLACRAATWERLARNGYLSRSAGTLSSDQRGANLDVVETGDFDDQEVDDALRQIGAPELVVPPANGEWPDPRSEAIRELLKHPITFGLYASLRATGDATVIEDLTWSTLVERYVNVTVEKAADRCEARREALLDSLITLARRARENRARDFYLNVSDVKVICPELGVDDRNPTRSWYAALLDQGVLHERPAPERQQQVGFRLADVGAYFLSLSLARQADGLAAESLRNLCADWLQEGQEFWPLLDAIMAWVDRLAESRPLSQGAADPRLTTIVAALIDVQYSINLEVVFRLLKPAVLAALFDLIGQKEHPTFYPYGKAAEAVPSSETARGEIRRHLHDPHLGVRRMAIRLAGLYRDEASIPTLIGLAEDHDREVKLAACVALSRIGEPAIDPLLAIANDDAQPGGRRIASLNGLRAIGIRNDRISQALDRCLRDGMARDTLLVSSALLAAAYLRDARQVPHAITALSAEWTDRRAVQAAAKLLTEVPDPSADGALLSALRAWETPARNDVEASFVLRQILAALRADGTEDAEEAVRETVRQGLRDSGGLKPVEAIWAIDRLDMPQARADLFEQTMAWLEPSPTSGPLWHAFRALASTWRIEHADMLRQATDALAARGVDVARRVTDLISNDSNGQQSIDRSELGLPAVRAIAKCRPHSFVAEAGRLLVRADRFLVRALSDALWIVGDAAAEGALLAALEVPVTQSDSGWFERLCVVRALGTCASPRGAQAVVDYLRSEPDISIDLPREALCPLVGRGVLPPERLTELALDTGASTQGRTASILALGLLDAPRHVETFRAIAESAGDPSLRGYAVRMLGFARDRSDGARLRRLLHRSVEPFIAAQAAEALARLDMRNAADEIGAALHAFSDTEHAASFVWALAQLKEQRTLPTLLETLDAPGSIRIRQDVVEALGSFLTDAEARRVVLCELETWHGHRSDRGDQCPPIRALVDGDPRLLLAKAVELYDAAHLQRSARRELARHIRTLVSDERIEGELLLPLLERLVSDRYRPIREEAVQSLGRLNPTLCRQLFERLRDRKDEWLEACAIYSLGFWDAAERDILAARFAETFSVRLAADAALAIRSRRRDLQQLVAQYGSHEGLARLAAYLSIEEQGDEQTMWALYDKVSEDHAAFVFLDELGERVARRLKKERDHQAKEEEKLADAPGMVKFD